jgi:NAD(P)-dependent dehydrogenase (short-subunit alcohol dehydrogenase family)
MDLKLTGKVAVVTGASQGIGRAVAETLLAEGARVVTASRGPAPAIHDEHHVHVVADLARPDGPAEVVARAAEAFGRLDVLVNNVGAVGPSGGFLATDDAAWQAGFDVNFFSFVRTTRAALPLLLEDGGGSIVNVSSINARMPIALAPDYGAAKAAMTNLAKALSEEFAPQGVRVNTVSPGPVRTPLWQAAGGMAGYIAGVAGVDEAAVMTAVLPEMMNLSTGRVAEADEVARLVAVLASPLSANTTGSDFVIDSGALKGV